MLCIYNSMIFIFCQEIFRKNLIAQDSECLLSERINVPKNFSKKYSEKNLIGQDSECLLSERKNVPKNFSKNIPKKLN